MTSHPLRGGCDGATCPNMIPNLDALVLCASKWTVDSSTLDRGATPVD